MEDDGSGGSAFTCEALPARSVLLVTYGRTVFYRCQGHLGTDPDPTNAQNSSVSYKTLHQKANTLFLPNIFLPVFEQSVFII